MKISLTPHEAAPPLLAPRYYDPELDCITSILSDICAAWEGHAVFHVSGFGRDLWPLDIRTDLCVLIESLPVALSRLRMSKTFVLDFYEQGFECRIEGDMYNGRCRLSVDAFGSWPPDRTPITVSAETMEQQLEAVLATFLHMVQVVAPQTALHPWFTDWTTGNT